jgi:hypothetical protein
MANPYDVDSNGDDPKVAIAEWTWGKAPISCPWVNESENTYDFSVKKADRIFDLLLEKKQMRLPANHVIPSAKELKVKKCCKFHNVTKHGTMSAKSSASTSRRPSSKGKSSLSQLRDQQ